MEKDVREQHTPAATGKADLNILTNSLTTIYTPNSIRRPALGSIILCNTDSSARTVDLSVNDGSTDYYLLNSHSLAAGETYVLKGAERVLLHLETTWTIKALASVTNVVHCTLSILEEEGRALV